MLRAALLFAILLSACCAALAQNPPCLIVYGHGRNLGSEAENLAWDRLNLRFNQQVAASLDAAGRRVVPMLLRVGSSSDLGATLEAVLGEAQRQGCELVVDTAVFADDANAALVLRLRVHPLLPALGPRAAASLPRVGEAIYTSQRDFDFSPRVLERLQLDRLAQEMTAGYLADSAPRP
ncbi:hypothetical protein [Paucibacter soli]|uniref:hypothetical protein n=1 Tax=Paucibacter soli TaxID=3133433 RepID=UPI0030964C02